MTEQDRERLLSLLADRATIGLLPEERLELAALQQRFPDVDGEEFERAAAALDPAMTEVAEAGLPEPLRARVAAGAAAYFASAAVKATFEPPVDRRLLEEHNRKLAAAKRGQTWSWLAVAACLALAAAGWLLPRKPVAPPSNPAAQRLALLAQAGDVRTLAWTATTDPAATGASGDVVWSADRQLGFMRFSGLEANDPGTSQYQLWIFDKDRDDRYPVDGGVFDVGPDGEVVVPIRAKLLVDEAVLFAITVEKPGGVVVSSRERIVLTAAPES